MLPAFEDLQPAAEPVQATTKTSHDITNRIASLDVLRGIAVLGGLVVSIWLFGGFTRNQQLQFLLAQKGYNYSMYALVSILFEGKMLSMICLVFGAGMIIYLQKKQEGKYQAADLFIRRQLWLLGFGILNALLFLWSGDILFHLAVLGILLFAFVKMSGRGLLIAGIIAALLFSGKTFWRYADDKKAYSKYLAVLNVEKKIKKDSTTRAKDSIATAKKVNPLQAKANAQIALAKPVKDTLKTGMAAVKKDTLTGEQTRDKQAWEGIVKSKKYDPKADEGDFKMMRQTSYGQVYDHVLPAIQQREAQWTYTSGIWDMSSMMLIGMALFKFGFFAGAWSRKRYLLIAAIGLIIGLSVGWLRLYVQHLSIVDYEKFIKLYPFPYNFYFPFEKVFLSLGYASIVMLLLHVNFLKNGFKILSSVGKLALSNYLLQSLLCMIAFTGFGMGYFGRLDQYQLYLFVLEIWIIQVVATLVWLRFFSQGPAEWLWRCLLHWKWFPIKKHATEISAEPTPAIL